MSGDGIYSHGKQELENQKKPPGDPLQEQIAKARDLLKAEEEEAAKQQKKVDEFLGLMKAIAEQRLANLKRDAQLMEACMKLLGETGT